MSDLNPSNIPYLPRELLYIIFSYDGRIRYRNGMFSNRIPSNDDRYAMLEPILYKKIHILSTMVISGSSFYVEFEFDSLPTIGLSYDYHWTYLGKYEICYYNFQYSNARRYQYRMYD